MNLEEIKAAVNAGKTVHVNTAAYIVIKNSAGIDNWLIKCTLNDYCIGLTWADGVTLNADESAFFIRQSPIQMVAVSHIAAMLYSMKQLTALWDEHPDELDDTLVPEYPFIGSFDELTIGVQNWLNSAKTK